MKTNTKITLNLAICLLFITIPILFLNSCVEPIRPFSGLAPGVWKGVLFIDPNKSVSPGIQERYGEEINLHEMNDEGILPFLFEVIYDSDSIWHIEIINGDERIPIKNTTFGRTKSDADNNLEILFEEYDAQINAVVKEDIMQGHFIVHNKKNYRIPFAAYYGKSDRFVLPASSSPVDLSGQWKVTFSPDSENEYDAIGIFEQNGDLVQGTFLTETGDYRYLDGAVIDNKLWLSTFDGAHAFLFHAKLADDGQLIGTFRSGKHYEAPWIAIKNSEAKLASPDSLTAPIMENFSLTFPDENGNSVTIPSGSSDHVKIIQILGTWCPNCKDEVHFLLDYLNQYSDTPLQITGVAFERYKDRDAALAAIKRYRKTMEIPYPILWGGSYQKSEATKKLPMIDELISYPTMIILDKENRIRKIHTGFYGPATPQFEEFKTSFHDFIQKLSNE